MAQPVAHDFRGTVRRGLRNLRAFSGRDTRPEFWLYLAAVYGMTSLGTFVVMMPSAISLILGPDPLANGTIVLSMAGIMAFVVALLAGAVCRRLHDTGRRGWWGLLPVPPFAVELIGWWQSFTSPLPPEDELGPGFTMIAAGHLSYFVGLTVVAILCALPGNASANRFGPPPPPPLPGFDLGAQSAAGGA